MDVSNKTVALVAVAGLALAGYAGAASSGLLPEGIDAGLGTEARQARLAQAQERCLAAQEEGAQVPPVCERILNGEEPPYGKARGHDRPRGGDRHHPEGHAAMRALGPFEVGEDGTVTGKWVSFTVDAEQGMLRDYTSVGPFTDAVIFDRVALEPVTGEQRATTRGPFWMAKDGEAGVAAFNGPNALLAARNGGAEVATLTFDVGDGIAAELTDEGVLLSKDGKQAWIRTRGDTAALAVDGDLVTATLGEGDVVAFAVDGYPGLNHMAMRALQHMAGEHQDREAPEGAPPAEAAEAGPEEGEPA